MEIKKRLITWICLCLTMTLVTSCYINDFDDTDDTEQKKENENTETDITIEVEELKQRVNFFRSEISPLVQKCDSAIQMQSHIDKIEAMPQVLEAWVEDEAFCIKDKSEILHIWDFQDIKIYDNEIEDKENYQSRFSIEKNSTNVINSRADGVKRACILLTDDEKLNPNSVGNALDILFRMIGGFAVVNIIEGNEFGPDFFLSEDFLNYDVYFIHNHGCYTKKTGTHWLLTNIDYNNFNPNQLKANISKEVKITDKLGVWYSSSAQREKLLLSQYFFSDIVFKQNEYRKNCTFKNKPIIFNTACQSMANSNTFGTTFVYAGMADAYMGFSTTISHSSRTGMHFFRILLEQKYSFMGALKALSFIKCRYWSTTHHGKEYTCLDFAPYYDKEEKKNTVIYLWENTLDTNLEYVKAFDDRFISPHESIDMGGKVKWATRNIGASEILELGDSLRWGEVTPLYEWIVDSEDYSKLGRKIYKYDMDNSEYFRYDIDGYGYHHPQRDIDGDKECDAATAYLGKGWRLPTKEDFEELLYSEDNNIEKVTSTSPNYLRITNKKNGNQIILPYPDFDIFNFNKSLACHYWTSEIFFSVDENGNIKDEKEAWALLPVGIPPFYQTIMSDCPGYLAGFVRPVYEGQ